ncbi:hypothetical protein [Paenibacillus gansuensis]|uniref:Uncharacterized protein n=1 Tax=Paenibacillus gansuensis TaxID=306542 RepID=A0ABW5PD06_9BACL
MRGSLRWNFIGAGTGMVLTFVLSLGSNLLQTTLIRSLYSFVILFVLIFMFRLILGILMGINGAAGAEETQGRHGVGGTLDYVTPDDSEELNGLLKNGAPPESHQEPEDEEADLSFAPLEPPQLVNKNKLQPEELAKAIRHLNEE